jgi:hypothetical protein
VALPEALLRHFTAMPVRRRAGVYLLLRGEAVVYIGQSGDVDGRLAEHCAAGLVSFDSALVMETDRDRRVYERALIYALTPDGNKMVADIGKPKRAALADLGLAVPDEERSRAAVQATGARFSAAYRKRHPRRILRRTPQVTP